MRVQEARAVARQWVSNKAAKTLGFAGAYTAGSTNWLPGDKILPSGSDVDIMVVLDLAMRREGTPPPKLGKFRYRDVLLEVTYLDLDQLQPPERVLGDYHLGASLYTADVVLDPSGRLAGLQAMVAADFPRRQWVLQRCEQAYQKIRRQLHAFDAAAPFPEQVIGWLFPTGIMAHVLLVAGLKNPTVRLRYRAARELLDEYGISDYYPTLLGLLGCATLEREQVQQHLEPLTRVFDAARDVICSPYFFASDLTESARPIAIDGARALIQQGDHREAIFWMVATYSRSQIVLLQDGPPAIQEEFAAGYHALLADLGIHSTEDLQQRGAQVLAHLPYLWRVAETIMHANPLIRD